MNETSINEFKVQAAKMAEVIDCCPEVQMARMFTVSAIGLILVQISDARWERIMEVSDDPCGEPLCDCQEETGRLLRTLDQHRTYAQKIVRGPQP